MAGRDIYATNLRRPPSVSSYASNREWGLKVVKGAHKVNVAHIGTAAKSDQNLKLLTADSSNSMYWPLYAFSPWRSHLSSKS